MDYSEMAMRLASAAICGAIIGFEREQQQKPAGLRTHMLVSIGSAAFTMSALGLDEAAGLGKGLSEGVAVDPSRVIQGIAGGIGFLGAGAIIRSGGAVHGLTTAATIWLVGGVGIGCGVGNYALAGMTTLLAVAIASILGMVEAWLFAHKPAPNSKEAKGHGRGREHPSSAQPEVESEDEPPVLP